MKSQGRNYYNQHIYDWRIKMASEYIKVGNTHVTVQNGLAECITLDVKETIDFSRLTKITKNALCKAITQGVVPVQQYSNSKLGNLYNSVCKKFNMPKAFLSTQSKQLKIEEVDKDMYEEFMATSLLASDRGDVRYSDKYKIISLWETNVPLGNVAMLIEKYRPIDKDKIERALQFVKGGEKLITERKNISFPRR